MKQTRAAVVRRRRLATSLSALAVIVVTVVIVTQFAHSSHPHARASTGSNRTLSPATKGGGEEATTPPTATAEVTALHQAIAKYIAKRHGAVSVAVYDRNTKKLVLVNPKVRGRTASIVKVDILETLLHRTGGELTEDQRETATAMIENSDNDSATDLFDQDGEAAGLKAYNDDVGLTQTTPNSAWGDTMTSAADQVALVRELLGPSTLLTKSARLFERTLMRHVESDQQWGIGHGVPHSAIFGNKNGWLPVDEDHDLWAVNSIGWVQGDGKSYVIAVITQHDATEDYGIATIEHIAQQTWKLVSVKASAS